MDNELCEIHLTAVFVASAVIGTEYTAPRVEEDGSVAA